MSMIAEKVFEALKALPDQDAAEVLDFVEHLQARRRQAQDGAAFDRAGPGGDGEKPVTPEEHAAWVEQMRAITAAQPMTRTTVEDMRREARY